MRKDDSLFSNVFELEDFQRMIDGGYITERPHPYAPLLILNYTPKAQYENVWNDATLSCRGLIVDCDGNVVSRPFQKFFNLEQMDTLPDEPFEVYEKLDGSLGISYWIDDKMHIATRGSFESEQAQWATAWIQQFDTSMLSENHTYLFEIIYPGNRIVVNYGDRAELVLLAVINAKTGKELPIDGWYYSKATKIGDVANVHDLASLQVPNAEGFVIKYKSGLRVKVKFAEYVRLHKLITGATEKSVLAALAQGDNLAHMLENVPDEFYSWLTTTINAFQQMYASIEARGQAIVDNTDASTRKEYAQKFTQTDIPALLFAMLDGKDYSRIIWSIIEKSLDNHTQNVIQ